ncbi:rhodanese-like domain-containing protein [Flavobacterium litorale]|uniref:Rhodanese-like domain-containing protein n=1 Tax=Flavobacterium litorale TaxID=2856519 RepID=A0ABX8V9P0_9FLAO|nr:rhodanese-like domain-containing protein [Flavobacterium litorale]QYJ67540.1 rhodanese-like domain-containing protein [Flavobacterium litorale]
MNLSEQEWWQKAQADTNAVLLDVRTEDEVNNGIIPNAINIDIYKGQGFIDELETLDKTKNYYVYCAAGGRSAQACSVMNQLGFSTAYNLLGGISQWNGPVVLPK